MQISQIKYKLILLITLISFSFSCNKDLPLSLVPNTPSQAPDYFCTWNLQGYVCSHQSNESFRYAMNEKYLFGDGPLENWLNAFPEIRMDMDFVMDDSWDIPQDQNDANNDYLGSMVLDSSRFPSFTGTNSERLLKLVTAIKKRGWRGAGGWVCAQEPLALGEIDPENFWTERLKEADAAGFSYWKVDWGKQSNNEKWRRMLSDLGHKYAPNLFIEHVLDNSFITFSDAFRTYDVENVISQPTTIGRIVDLLPYKTEKGAKGIINCEDEPYIAAGLGCAIGVMRHQFAGAFPDGKQDWSFPPTGRNMKMRRDEVIRGIRWHRIAQPFAVGGEYAVDSVKLEDYWTFKERETWLYWDEKRLPGNTIKASAPARVSRNLPLLKSTAANNPNRPFLLSSLYPNGAIAIVSIGRALSRDYVTVPVEVEQEVPQGSYPIGIFGKFKKVTLVYPEPIEASKVIVLGQDLATDKATNITSRIIINANQIIIPEDVIMEIGLQKVSENDESDPGFVMQIFSN